jgi:hypothetical protein
VDLAPPVQLQNNAWQLLVHEFVPH